MRAGQPQGKGQPATEADDFPRMGLGEGGIEAGEQGAGFVVRQAVHGIGGHAADEEALAAGDEQRAAGGREGIGKGAGLGGVCRIIQQQEHAPPVEEVAHDALERGHFLRQPPGAGLEGADDLLQEAGGRGGGIRGAASVQEELGIGEAGGPFRREHAGEGGLFGREELDVIIPAVEAACAQGLDVSGPFAPDTVFMRARTGEFDAVVAMYHDQGLIPVMYLGVEQGVNVTLGLPLVRTSPDHGTAFDIAGTGRADAASLVQALRMAKSLSAAAGLTS